MMLNKKLLIIVFSVIAFGLMAAYGINQVFTASNINPDDVQIELISAAYSNDALAIEYAVEGEITTPEGLLDGCPVGKTSIINKDGQEIDSGEDDYIYCRADGINRYLVSQFLYHDYSGEGNHPVKVKITLGDVDFISASGQDVHVSPINDFFLDLPDQADLTQVSMVDNTSEAPSGLKMKVTRADFTTSLGKIDACITLPDTGDWVFDAYLIVNDQKLPFEYWFVKNFRETGAFNKQERCYSIIMTDIPDYTTIEKGQMSILIEKVSRNMPECVDETGYNKIKDELAKYDIHPEPDAGGNYCFASAIQKIADPDINAQLNQYIRNALQEEIMGPIEIVLN